MNRPDVSKILRPLKPFQRRTVDHAFHRLFTATDSTARFLVADEVGLGKTLVARGVIARTVEHLWETVKRIDIVYICSNSAIARSNLQKLQVGGGVERSFATRLTMLATELARGDGRSLRNSKLNFVSFTPGTSFNLRSSGGRAEERVLLFHLLRNRVARRTGLMNLLQVGAGKDNWRRLVRWKPPIDASIQKGFCECCERQGLIAEADALIDEYFYRHRAIWPDDAKWQRNELVGKLRELLARQCVHALEPDLVILDEFQRFRSLLEPSASDAAVELAQSLFNAETPEGQPVRTLLLSATPYKLYTSDAEIDREDHYEDFIATTRFLLRDDEPSVRGLQRDIAGFGAALKRAAIGGPDEDLRLSRERVQDSLRRVMARTERVAATTEKDSMVEEEVRTPTPTAADVRQYLCADNLFRAVGDRDPMPYWKSASYLAQFMHGYKFNDRLVQKLNESPDQVAEAVRSHSAALLRRRDFESWQAIDPANPKLRQVVSDFLDYGLWQLLWLPPTLPYWELEGPFAGMNHVTKTLLFSAWNVVPEVVSGILSYEAERRMVDGSPIGRYDHPEKQQRPRLRFDSAPRSRHRLFLLLLPCTPLADIHPLTALSLGSSNPRQWVRARVAEMMTGLPDPKDAEEDKRWEWAAPLLLDPGLRDFLQEWRDDEGLPHPNPEQFGDYVNDLLALDLDSLGRRPTGLLDLLTDLALGSPGVLAVRSLGMSNLETNTRRRLAVGIAEAFWHLFNRPAAIALLTRLDAGSHADKRYWRVVLRYCQQGNLQAVLDEQWHLLWEQNAWGDDLDRDSVAASCARLLAESIRPKPSRVHARLFDGLLDGSHTNFDEIRIRTIFALRYGTTTDDGVAGGEQRFTEDVVRAAFNSPFRPFVLASTSVGQEGLDFHPWCHRVMHWDLPGNPVDLEQREGRVHRYKGHAVRRNVAARWRDAAMSRWKPGDDLWQRLFELADAAARTADVSDLVPYWIAYGDSRVQRSVPLLPYTRDTAVYERLKRQLAAYRVVFGQPRQEELLSLLDQSRLTASQLRDWAINLSPPE